MVAPTNASNVEDTSEAFDELEDLEPSFALIGRFIKGATLQPWFANVGTAFNDDIRRTATLYLDALGFPDATLVQSTDWEEAGDVAESYALDSSAWEVDEQLRAALTVQACEMLGEEAVQIMLAHVSAQLGPAVKEAAEESHALWDVQDESLRNAAVGSAVQATHQACLVLAVSGEEEDEGEGEDDLPHPFALKFKLFECGRWPVGIVGATFNLF